MFGGKQGGNTPERKRATKGIGGKKQAKQKWQIVFSKFDDQNNMTNEN